MTDGGITAQNSNLSLPAFPPFSGPKLKSLNSFPETVLSSTVTEDYLWTLPTVKDPLLSGGVSAFPVYSIQYTIEGKSHHVFEPQFHLL